jgi:BNR/Asp-box repeat
MTHRIRAGLRSAVAAALALLASACADRTPTTAAPPVDGGVSRTLLTCTATVQQPSLRCEEAGAGGGASQNIMIGGQGTYVRLSSSGPSYDGSSTFRVDVTVQNLLSQRMGTPDGTTVYGMKVVFSDGPYVNGGTGSVSVANPDGSGIFTAAEQPYFAYAEILEPYGSSDAREWRFTVPPTVESFRFSVYVETQLGVEDGVLRWQREAGALLPPTVASLQGVWAAGPFDVFAAGQNSILHFDGEAWTVMKRTDTWMRDIAGNSLHDAYAVGDGARVLHFDGNAWTDVPAPALNGPLFGVWVQGENVVAVGVGDNTDATRRVGKVYHSSNGGETWEVEESADTRNRQLLDVWGSGPGDLYAVGSDFDQGVAGSGSGVILRSTDGGATWKETLHPDAAERLYTAVWGWDADNVLVGGTRTDPQSGRRQAVILYSTDGGENWEETIIASPTGDRYVRSLWGSPSGEVYAVGFSGTRLRYNGTEWEDAGGPGPSLNAVHGTEEGHVFAVGTGQAILRHDGSSWQMMSPVPHTNVTFRSVGGVGNEAFAVGHRPRTGGGGVEGVVFRRLDTGWTPVVVADSTEYLDVWGAGTAAFAVGRRIRSTGSSGVILRWNGSFWANISPDFPRDRELTAVWGSGPNDIWVLGSQATVGGTYVLVALHSTNGGDSWTEQTLTLADVSRPNVADVHGVSATEAYAVGRTSTNQRLTLHLNAAGSWEQEDFGVPSYTTVLEGVLARAPGEVYGVGTQTSGFAVRGIVLKRNESGSSWDPWAEDERESTRYHAVWSSPAGDVYVVGAGGRIRHFDGTRWTEMGPAHAPALRGIWGSSDGNVYAVGENGMVLHGWR